jgi:hypothetical protein
MHTKLLPRFYCCTKPSKLKKILDKEGPGCPSLSDAEVVFLQPTHPGLIAVFAHVSWHIPLHLVDQVIELLAPCDPGLQSLEAFARNRPEQLLVTLFQKSQFDRHTLQWLIEKTIKDSLST